MRRAVALARRGEGHTRPNPAVGAVVVRAGRIVGDPWFKHLDKPCIDRFVEAVHKVAANAEALKAWKPAAEEPKTLPGWNRKS